MRIPVPSSVHPLVRLTANIPGHDAVTGEFISGMPSWDLPLPEGVSEEEVGIVADYLKANHEVADSIVVQVAIEKPATEKEEDAEELSETEGTEVGDEEIPNDANDEA
jgi:hypothetical protein